MGKLLLRSGNLIWGIDAHSFHTSKYLDFSYQNRSYASALIGPWRLQHVSLALAWGSWSESLERCWLKTTGENAVRDAPRPGDSPFEMWDDHGHFMHIENMKTLETLFRHMHMQMQINISIELI